jgi:hypothetical protein
MSDNTIDPSMAFVPCYGSALHSFAISLTGVFLGGEIKPVVVDNWLSDQKQSNIILILLF